MSKLHFKTKKCKLKDILRIGINYDYFKDCIIRADKLAKLGSLFIRSYLLYLFENDKEIPTINIHFIHTCFRVLITSSTGRPPEDRNNTQFEQLKKYYNEAFKETQKNILKKEWKLLLMVNYKIIII